MAKVVMPDLNTGNSLKNRGQSDENKKAVPKVTKGAVKTSDKEHKGFFKTFIEDDAEDIKSYVVSDVIVPAIKNLIFDTIVGSIEMALFGTTSRSRSKGGSNASHNYVSYNKFSDNSSRRTNDSGRNSRNDYQSIIFEERADAEEVLDTLQNLIDDYGKATIGDLYDASGITPDDNFAKNEEYGWNNLNSARVQRTREGYFIDLPRAKYLN